MLRSSQLTDRPLAITVNWIMCIISDKPVKLISTRYLAILNDS